MSNCFRTTRPALSLLAFHTTGRRTTRQPWQMKHRFFKNTLSCRAYHKDTIARMAETETGGNNASNSADLDMRISEVESRGNIPNFISDWKDNWFCYWDDSYDLPDDPEKDFVFKPPLQISRCGVVRTQEDDWEGGEISKSDMEAIRIISDLCNVDSEHYIGRGDEADNCWSPMAIQWSASDGDLSPQNLLKRLGAHPEVMDTISKWDYMEDDIEDEEERMFEDALQAFLGKYESRVFFCSGDSKLNPVPCFAMAQVSPILVAGFVGGVIYT